MAILGGVATPYMTALKAHAEMNPAIAGLEAVFAAFGGRLYGFNVFLCVSAGCLGHGYVFSLKMDASAIVRRVLL